MSQTEDYLKQKIKDFKQNYNAEVKLNSYSNKELRLRWKDDKQSALKEWHYINNIADVERYVTCFVEKVKHYNNMDNLLWEDSYDMDLFLYKAMLAMNRMEQCFENNKYGFSTCDEEKIDSMFEKLNNGLEMMNDVILRIMMQEQYPDCKKELN